MLTALYYFYQYALRSAPSVMMPQLSEAFGVSALGVASIVGLFYYGYSPFSLVAGAAMDQLGPRRVLPIAAAVVGVGALLFATGRSDVASVGRVLQGAGGVFALVGAIYIATKNFPASKAATLVGATQMFGMAGGSAGQFVVGPMIGGGLAWNRFWIGMGIAGLGMGVLLFAFLTEGRSTKERPDNWLSSTVGILPRCVQQSAVDPVRFDRRAAFYPDHDLRHGLGGALPPGGTRPRLRISSYALVCGSIWVDHRLPAPRFHLRPPRATKAGNHRRRGCASGMPGLDTLRSYRSVPSLTWSA